MVKVCLACGVSKELTEFYTHPETSDGYINKCKACKKEESRKNRERNIDYYRAYDRRRAESDHRKENTKRVVHEYRKKYPERRRANNLVAKALQAGSLIKQPCERCGESKAFAHHEDYNKPLDVVWLCQPCHKQRHKELEQL